MNQPEFLTVAEFADRLKVSRTTVFSWLKNGELREGADFIRLGRILRFRWPYFNNRLPSPQPVQDVQRKPSLPEQPTHKRQQSSEKQGTAPAINLDYCLLD